MFLFHANPEAKSSKGEIATQPDTHLDPSALAGAALSAVLATMLVYGHSTEINLILGITILVLLVDFVEGHMCSRFQSMVPPQSARFAPCW